MLANNLANASTAGFKTDRESYGIYLSEEAAGSSEGTNPAVLPVIQNRWTDFSQGALRPTGNSTDLALNGNGFFVASTGSGLLYTRDGTFRLSREGQLETQEGYPIQSSAGKPIVLDSTKTFEVTPQGEVRQGTQVVAQIAVVDFENPATLSKRGGNYFQSSLYPDSPPAGARAEIQQGKIEAANSESARSAAGLVSILRQFESLQKALTIGADMNRRVVEEVAKVGA
jgi:flagellar basal-body rod protein FlgF